MHFFFNNSINLIYSAFSTDSSKYPRHKIHLQTGLFDTLDLLVELAQRHHVNVKLNILQQVFFYKTKYKHLFEYDAQIPNAAELNEKFRFKNQPEVCVVPYEAADMEAYKRYVLMCWTVLIWKWRGGISRQIISFFRYFDRRKIITIRLIASERLIGVTPEAIKKGLVYVSVNFDLQIANWL